MFILGYLKQINAIKKFNQLMDSFHCMLRAFFFVNDQNNSLQFSITTFFTAICLSLAD